MRARELLLPLLGVVLLPATLWCAIELHRLLPEIRARQGALRHLGDLRAHASDVQAAARGYVLTDDRWYLEPARTATEAIDDDIRMLSRLLADDEHAARFEALAQAVRRSVDEGRRLVTTRDDEGLSAARRLVRSAADQRVMEEVRSLAGRLQLDLRTALARDRSARDARVERLALLAIALTVALGVALRLSVRGARERRELERYRRALGRLRASGALGVSVWDAQGTMIEANDEYLRIFGHTRASLPARPHWSTIIGPRHGRAVSTSALELSSSGICRPFLLPPTADGRALPSVVWSVVADDERHVVTSFAIEIEGVLAAAVASSESDAFSPLVRNVKLPASDPPPLEAAFGV